MDYLKLMQSIESVKNSVKLAHQDALSNGILKNDDERNDLFSKFDGKSVSINNGIMKAAGLTPGEYDYVLPGRINPNMHVTPDTVIGKVLVVKTNLEKIQEGLKATKYKIVNKNLNKIHYLNNSTKSVFTKAVADLDKIIESLTEKA